MCLIKDHNTVTQVWLAPAALRSRVKHSTSEPLRSLVDCLYNISLIRLSMHGRNVSFITLSIQSMDSQYNISRLPLSIQHHIQWTVNTKSHGLDCQCKVEMSQSLHCQYNQCIVNTIYHALHFQYYITFSGLLIQNLMDWNVNAR